MRAYNVWLMVYRLGRTEEDGRDEFAFNFERLVGESEIFSFNFNDIVARGEWG